MNRSARVGLGLGAACLINAAAAVADDYTWLNVQNFPDDLVSTGDGWSALRAETPDRSYRIAADDFTLTETTRITRVTFWGAEVGDPNILGGDFYIFESNGAGGPPGALIAAYDGLPMDHIDTGLDNTFFDTVYENTMTVPDNEPLVLEPGNYFLAFRTYQTLVLDGPKNNNAAFTTRYANGTSRAWWNFDVWGDGWVDGPWVPMEDFNLVEDQEWSFRIEGETGGLTLTAPNPGEAGEPNALQATGAGPGNRIYFVASLRSGSTAVPGCPGVSVDMSGPDIIGNDVADAGGVARINVFVPDGASGRSVRFQVVDRPACEKSNLVVHTFP